MYHLKCGHRIVQTSTQLITGYGKASHKRCTETQLQTSKVLRKHWKKLGRSFLSAKLTKLSDNFENDVIKSGKLRENILNNFSNVLTSIFTKFILVPLPYYCKFSILLCCYYKKILSQVISNSFWYHLVKKKFKYVQARRRSNNLNQVSLFFGPPCRKLKSK